MMHSDDTEPNRSSAGPFQLIEGTNAQQKEGLGIMTPDYYNYLNQSGTYKVDGTNDSKDFQETMVRLFYYPQLLSFQKSSTGRIFRSGDQPGLPNALPVHAVFPGSHAGDWNPR